MSKHVLFGNFEAQAGKGPELVAILQQAAVLMAGADGCDLYLVSTSADEPAKVYVYEQWDNEAAHDASLSIEGVAPLISQAIPLLAAAPTPGIKLIGHGGHGVARD